MATAFYLVPGEIETDVEELSVPMKWYSGKKRLQSSKTQVKASQEATINTDIIFMVFVSLLYSSLREIAPPPTHTLHRQPPPPPKALSETVRLAATLCLSGQSLLLWGDEWNANLDTRAASSCGKDVARSRRAVNKLGPAKVLLLPKMARRGRTVTKRNPAASAGFCTVASG